MFFSVLAKKVSRNIFCLADTDARMKLCRQCVASKAHRQIDCMCVIFCTRCFYVRASYFNCVQTVNGTVQMRFEQYACDLQHPRFLLCFIMFQAGSRLQLFVLM